MDKGGTQTNDQTKRKLMTMYKALHLRNDIGRLYVSRNEGGRGYANIAGCLDESIQGIEKCIKKSKERMITAASDNIGNIKTNIKSRKTRKQKWE